MFRLACWFIGCFALSWALHAAYGWPGLGLLVVCEALWTAGELGQRSLDAGRAGQPKRRWL